MKKVLRIKCKMALYGVMTALLMVGMVKTARSDNKPADNLSPEEIFKKAQDTYDSMTSYSDKGKTVVINKSMLHLPLPHWDTNTSTLTVTHLNDVTFITTFTTKLARPSLYRIEWEEEPPAELSQGITKTNKGIVWSAGEGDFWNIGNGPEKQKDQHSALTGYDGDGPTEALPGAFFKMGYSNPLGTLGPNLKREVDEKVGDIDCYVFSKEYSDQTETTLWIGKRDFLIHQFRLVSNATKFTSTETHSDIVVNQKFLPTDFTP
jgi:outer membrane lipoprotein-sorting protein